MSDRHLIIGIFSRVEDLVTAGRLVKERGFRIVEIYSPFPSDEIDKILEWEKSPVRYFTLLGGLLGLSGGFALTVGVAMRHGIQSGGKPIIAIPPFVIIAFELTILLSALLTMVGFLWNARSRGRSPAGTYHGGFTKDRFGLLVTCGEGEEREAIEMLSDAGAVEARHASD
jgi:molybdopterin-containing oxidoreductase family membrane subunit